MLLYTTLIQIKKPKDFSSGFNFDWSSKNYSIINLAVLLPAFRI